MADTRTCDLCGAAPANRVEVGITLWDVAAPGSPTGHLEGVDACESCQEKATDVLLDHVRESLREQVPFHVALLGPGGHEEKLEAIQERLRLASDAVLAHERVHAHLGDRAPVVPDEVRVPHEAALLELSDETTARFLTLQEATALHDKRHASFVKSLAKSRSKR